ncbi:MAG: UDP-N-acetylmuramate dehydrogenase [Bacteroidales bacterium]|jgi:UDP-N-acetylmuramate dehydrogenase|nr:UDP-N-acetylmuramate dehydrogenase [Bacteroidales bacterium]MDZ4059520.1 UDP-N-acetylmuramate dehydrogenase [Bacteroidales bacterium]
MIIEKDKNLKGLNTLGLNINTAWYSAPSSVDEIRWLLGNSQFRELPVLIMGSGSNILFTGDFDGLVIHPALKEITITDSDSESVTLRVGAGVDWDDFVAYCTDRGWGGVENLSLIPGCVGASPVQNIGAYGSEVKETIVSVEYIDISTREGFTLTNSECRFGYRDSIFKRELRGATIITFVSFRLALNPLLNFDYSDVAAKLSQISNPSLHDVREAICSIRRAKLPDPEIVRNAGSFFKNPVVTEERAMTLKEANPTLKLFPADPGYIKLPAAWLIEQCGFKGVREGNTGVHQNQALVIVAYKGATGVEILEFAKKIKRAVKTRFDIDIEMEVNVIASS